MILALKTDGSTAQVWLYAKPDSPKPHAELTWESGRALADELLPRLVTFLAEHAAGWPDLTGIIIFSGPGSFTSLRIGHTVANAIADSLDLPITGGLGEAWADTARRALATTPPHQPALPYYGAEANITAPRSAIVHPPAADKT